MLPNNYILLLIHILNYFKSSRSNHQIQQVLQVIF